MTLNKCNCGGEGLKTDYGGSYAIACRCGVKTPIMGDWDAVMDYWNTLCPIGKPTIIRIKYHQLLEDYKKMMDNGTLKVFSMAVDHKRGQYVLTVRWN